MQDKFNLMLGWLVVITFLVGLVLFIFPIRIVTGTGEHTGYITAVDQKGLIWKNYHVYFKTDNQSSQEDEYCVLRFDKELANQVRSSSKERQLVTLKYETFIGINPSLCHASEIIGLEIK